MRIKIEKLNSFRLWLIFFFYTFFISALVQIILLPYVFPSLHAGKGLMVSSLDSIGFHQLAVDLADKIRIQGWSAWQLRPQGQAPAGIASIFYVFITPDPRIFILISAALHATASLVLVNLINSFVKNKFRSILCVIPFLVFPSSLQWTAQWHRDGFSILGFILILRAIVSLFELVNYKTDNWVIINIGSIIVFLSGFCLIGLVRPYILMIIGPFAVLLFSLLFFIILYRLLKKEMIWRKFVLILGSILFILFMVMQTKTYLDSASFRGNGRILINQTIDLVTNPVISKYASTGAEKHWKNSFWLPFFLDNKAYSLAHMRNGFRFTAGKSNIDNNVGFGSALDMLVYLPRAAQIVFLAPFPNQWLGEGSNSGNTLMRRIAAYEMIVVYLAFLFFLYALWHWRKRIEIWIIFLFCTYIMLMHGLVVCNVGSLYRMRYPYIMTLVSLGIAGFIVFLDDIRSKKISKA
ncbi:MAG: hypothetical protein WC574_04875 [Candidatus Omnitrophota bacterium]